MSEIRHALGHRFVTGDTGDDRCLGCGWDGTGRIHQCRPDTPRCERCAANGRDAPADVTEFIQNERFHYCAGCRLGIRVKELTS